MLTLQRLLTYGAHIFWYMMGEHVPFCCHREVVCLHGFRELFLKYVYIVFKFWVLSTQLMQSSGYLSPLFAETIGDFPKVVSVLSYELKLK